MMVGARPVFADIDPDAADDRPGRRRGRDHAAHARPSCRCTCTASRPTCARIMAHRRAARPRGRRGLLPGAPGDRAAAGRSAAFGVAARLQLLPDEEPRRARRRRRDHDRTTPQLAARLKRLRNGGQTDRYHHGEMGVNSRLDEMQAAILSRAAAAACRGWTAARRALAAVYRARAGRRAGVAVPPECDPGHVYHLFPVLSPRPRRAAGARCATHGIETLIHYPVPIPRQPALRPSRRPSARSPIASARRSSRCRCIRACRG